MDTAILILNHNGRSYLEKCLPSVIGAMDNCGQVKEIAVIDNDSSDASQEYIRSYFPQVRIIRLKENLSFTKAMNIGISEMNCPIVICLNNDIIVDKNFIAPLIRHFREEGNLFAVSAKMLFWESHALNFGRALGSFKYGFFTRRIVDSKTTVNTLYACAGGFAVEREKFLALGGFDEDMIVYWEDFDLCYRAWKRGWKILYEPESLLYHKFHGTYLENIGQKGIDALSGENYTLCLIKNLHDAFIFYKYVASLPLLVVVSLLAGKLYFVKGIFKSLRRWGLFLRKRRQEKTNIVLSDRAVFSITSR